MTIVYKENGFEILRTSKESGRKFKHESELSSFIDKMVKKGLINIDILLEQISEKITNNIDSKAEYTIIKIDEITDKITR